MTQEFIAKFNHWAAPAAEFVSAEFTERNSFGCEWWLEVTYRNVMTGKTAIVAAPYPGERLLVCALGAAEELGDGARTFAKASLRSKAA